jgi:membrane associated rhomboid family serine protease
MQQPVRRRFQLSLTLLLVIANVLAFLFQEKVLPRIADEGYFSLSLWGVEHGYVWQLLTYQFMHGSWPHLILNCWALFVFGRAVEWTIGKTRFLVLYLTSGIIGGLLQVLASLLWPHYFGGGTVGASASVFGVVATFALLFPEQQLIMLLFFVIPIKMRAKSLLWLLLIITALGISFPRSQLAIALGGNVAHAAHLGGILTGLAFTRFYLLKRLSQQPPQY